jgi:DNA-directed RNA polymerase specialized sigma subunit
MNIEYILIPWAAWVAGGSLAEDTIAAGKFKVRLNASGKTLEQAVDEAVERLPENLKNIIRLYYLERQSRIYCLETLGLNRDAFRLQISLAEQLIASAVFAD